MSARLPVPEFVARWRAARLSQRSVAQQHVFDLCAALDQPTPAAYGWPPALPDDEVLARRLALTLARAGGHLLVTRRTRPPVPPRAGSGCTLILYQVSRWRVLADCRMSASVRQGDERGAGAGA